MKLKLTLHFIVRKISKDLLLVRPPKLELIAAVNFDLEESQLIGNNNPLKSNRSRYKIIVVSSLDGTIPCYFCGKRSGGNKLERTEQGLMIIEHYMPICGWIKCARVYPKFIRM